MKKIIVPTDFSDNGNTAMRYAAQMAAEVNATLFLMTVFTVTDTSYSPQKALIEEYNNHIITDMQKQLEESKNALEKEFSIKVETKMYYKNIKEAILECASEEDADFIVMGNRGVKGIEKLLFGSVTTSVIGEGKVPVLAVPIGLEWAGIENILFATENLSTGSNILDPLLSLSSMADATVHVGVYSDEKEDGSELLMEKASVLQLFESNLPNAYKQIKTKTVSLMGNDFENAVDNYIGDNNIDLLVMTTHKRSFWERLFDKSLTKEMAYHTKIPLLAIPH